MAARELIVLGTAAQSPTPDRSQNSYVLRWNEELVVFDPGENTQQQLMRAGLRTSRIGRVFITHFHGDHCLGLPGLVQRHRLIGSVGALSLHYGAWGADNIERLLYGTDIDFDLGVEHCPHEPGSTISLDHFDVTALALDHTTPTVGWRLEEPPRLHMLPERLEERGIRGAAIGRLESEGRLDHDGATVQLAEVSETRPGQSFAFIMDTRYCENAVRLAAGVDLLVCEATYLDADEARAAANGHLTATQAARIAAEAGARRLVLSHFSERYADLGPFAAEAAAVFPDVVIAHEFDVVEVPAVNPA